MDGGTFLQLVNDVLKRIDRAPLEEGGSAQAIISVRPQDRVLQILAGPGSGKTEMLVWRVLYELFVQGTKSERIMVTTFTRRAATELEVRVVERCDALMEAAKERGISTADPLVHDLRIGTIHSLCDTLLAEYDDAYSATGTQVIDEAEVSVRLARDYRLALGFNSSPPKRLLNRLFENRELTSLFRAPWEDAPNWPSNIMGRVSCVSALINQQVETWIPRCGSEDNRLNGLDTIHETKTVTADLIKLQTRWERYLDDHQILDFATIQKRFLERQNTIQGLLTHIFVDEFQDNNPIQFAIHTAWLVTPNVRLTVVGDDDQAIYRFRGSDIECFNQLKPFCESRSIAYRQEKLETNFRSTKNIVQFTQEFRKNKVLTALSMPKHIVADDKAAQGIPVRLVQGPWGEISRFVANELTKIGAGRIPSADRENPASAAILMFSMSERGAKGRVSSALVLRRVMETAGIRVYNPRNKTAATSESPVSQLLGLISYLIDPISLALAGKNRRPVMVAATDGDPAHAPFAASHPPHFPINRSHLDFQKRYRKGDGGKIDDAIPVRKTVLNFVDDIRNNLVNAYASGRHPRLTLAGLVARLLCLPFFRKSGFTPTLFRQALFTQLLEANIAATRLTNQSLDLPLEVSKVKGKFVWPERFWNLLSVFGAFLDRSSLDDLEVDTFEQDAVLMLTFHQGKGLEFDHVFVGGTGRAIDVAPALRTRIFSGEAVKFKVDSNGAAITKNQKVLDLAEADRDREVYVAMTRAKKTLTILHDPSAQLSYMPLNPTIEAMFKNVHGVKSKIFPALTTKERSFK